MLNRVYEITYTADKGAGTIMLRCSDPDFSLTLAKVEQSLANTGATDIVYTVRPERPADLLAFQNVEQLSVVAEG